MRIFHGATDSVHCFCSSFCSHKRRSVPCNITGIEHQVALLRSRAIAPQVQELTPLCLEMDQEKHPNRQQRIINVLVTKRLSIIAPKSLDNYLCTLMVRHSRFLIIPLTVTSLLSPSHIITRSIIHSVNVIGKWQTSDRLI